MTLKVLHRHIVVTCRRRDGELIEVWIPADAGMGDRPDTAKPFVVAGHSYGFLSPHESRRRYLTPAEMREVEKI